MSVNEKTAMLTVTCVCGKITHGAKTMAGQSAHCMKCGRAVTFPALNHPSPAAVGAGLGDLSFNLLGDEFAPADKPQAPSAPRRLPCELFYWVFLLALAPLVIALTDRGDSNVKQRLARTLEAHPYLKPRVEEILHSEDATLDELFQALPGHRLDERAYLPRESKGHWVFAGWAVVGFFGLVGLVMAQRITPAWQLLLAGAFTATVGVAFLFLFQDFVGHSYELTLDPEQHFLTNLLGFVFVVGLGEELAKSLPVIFYIRTFKRTNWRGACLWGLASGIGFGVAEGILYSTHQYNGIAGLEVYLMRFISCVALHGLWSASVGITIFHSRKLVSKILGAVLYGGDWSWGELAVPLLRVLGIAMALHGLYDALLTQDMIPMALMVALVSFVWVGWQIENSREKEIAALAVAQPV